VTATTTPPTVPGVEAVNPLHLIFHVFYGMANSFTQVVGLTPLQLVLGLLALVVVIVLVQLVLVAFGKQGWHVDDVRGDRELTAQIRADLERE